MRTLLKISLTVLLLTAAFAEEHRVPASNPQFDALKSLSGDWTGRYEGKVGGTASYRVVSGGSAIILDMSNPGEASNMITMIHPDGQRTVATHYCSMGNQPRMVANSSADTKRIEFKFKDVTNDDGKSGYMRELTIVLIDKDHHDQIWTWQDGKGKQEVATFHYERNSAPAQGQ